MAVGIPKPGSLIRTGAVAVAAYYALWGGEYAAYDLRRLRIQTAEEMRALAATRVEVDSLANVATLLEDDPATIERVARERFGMIREGETLFRFIQLPPPAADSAGAAAASNR